MARCGILAAAGTVPDATVYPAWFITPAFGKTMKINPRRFEPFLALLQSRERRRWQATGHRGGRDTDTRVVAGRGAESPAFECRCEFSSTRGRRRPWWSV